MKRSINLFRLAVLTLAMGNAAPADAQSDCPSPTFLNAAHFFTSEKTGAIAWLQSEGATDYFILSDCNKLLINRNATKIFFNINNVVTLLGGANFSFVGVQVIRVQEVEQADLAINLERRGEWDRGGVLPEIRGNPDTDIDPTAFFSLVVAQPFDDTALKSGGVWWLADPKGGATWTNRRPAFWRPGNDFSDPLASHTLLVSNRLYRFQPNSGGQTGIPFEIGVRGTRFLFIRFFSPAWDGVVEIKVELVR